MRSSDRPSLVPGAHARLLFPPEPSPATPPPSLSLSELLAGEGGGVVGVEALGEILKEVVGGACDADTVPPLSRTHTITHTLSLSPSLSLSHTHTFSLSLTHTHTPFLSLAHTLSLSHTHSLSHTDTHTNTHTHTLSLSLSLSLSHTLFLSLSHTHFLSLTHTEQVAEAARQVQELAKESVARVLSTLH